MPTSLLNVAEVASALAIDPRSVQRLADARELPGRKVNGRWQFRAAEVTDWAARHLHELHDGQSDLGFARGSDLIVNSALQAEAVQVPLHATSRASVLRELVALCERSGQIIDTRFLLNSLEERERERPTAFPGGVAIPHPKQLGRFAVERPIIAACRLHNPIPFGAPGGALTDLFFVVLCGDYCEHLIHLGRLCRLLTAPNMLVDLRAASDAAAFIDPLLREEERLCASS